MNPLRQAIIADVVKQTGAHDEPHVFGGEPGDPGLTGPGTMSWEINGDIASVLIGGIGAIVMEILHPSVMAGVQDLSNYREQPERRGKTTFGYVVTTTFANTKAATRLVNVVKRMHGQVEGTRPDGVPYRALDPELIGWVHTCIPWAVMTAYERYNRPLTEAQKDRYLREQAVIGRMGGAEVIPESCAELRDYVEEMRPRLAVNAQTLQFFEFLMEMPFGVKAPAALARPAHRFQVEAGMSITPEWVRRMTGFHGSGATRPLHVPSLSSYARAVRWAFGTPAYRRLAEERAGGLVRATAPRPVAAGT
ncbi:MAG TPA: oxygenase MpaB family protein [Thermoleophilaceae bacterium]|nr:oxygenase MpaB family protein [Thermoleophilaceae bacterium]